MRNKFSYAAGLLGLGLIVGSAAGAGETMHEKHFIAVHTGEGEVIEADVSELQPGEARTFVTEDGTTVDVLRGPEGMEIYVDGELIEPGMTDEGEELVLHRELRIECDSVAEEECADDMLVIAEADAGLDPQAHALHKRIEVICEGEGDCEEQIWIDDSGAAVDIDALQDGEREIRVIRVHEEVSTDSTN